VAGPILKIKTKVEYVYDYIIFIFTLNWSRTLGGTKHVMVRRITTKSNRYLFVRILINVRRRGTKHRVKSNECLQPIADPGLR